MELSKTAYSIAQFAGGCIPFAEIRGVSDILTGKGSKP